ncbi:hypothetical protein [Burkholderia pseudomultivorans]|uniref:Uncharacterized protein n=1 Tax=Burkholderia pseudomultivorans TaxID=1207504 RepID=A0A6P2QD91_9BURK|nr:hypothetical protein [Burkholderia pseudomultivorans]MDR8729711.1 hypothetical protein [Burkholderia pseudomultivorans]MDR8737644.1 hypothetical protein [Burkholderia pseudomultivorans]MDR8743831.1 hypothetical protein [Burkholderia pseudomultivorans]MDR8755239.1 hypothetical protein [Burkholderia pseudomultivorans]MDR8780364.1 hypothetical protein [Burkholderia pseudomultivorans]
MKAPVDEVLVEDIAGPVAVVVTDVVRRGYRSIAWRGPGQYVIERH